ncbi:MAG: peptide chain release factor 2 [Clostridia bacterium]|nr:peptide chain release factor 2 [Clostridia bacterium]
MIILDEYKLKIEDYKKQAKDLASAMKTDELEARLSQIETLVAAPDFWNDMERSQKLLVEQKTIKDKLNRYKYLVGLIDDAETLAEMAQDEGVEEYENEMGETARMIEKEFEKQTLETLLNGEYDANNAILTLHAGAGGTEAQDWALMLYRMYCRFGEQHNYKVKTIDILDGEEAGIKSATVVIEGPNAYGYLKSEAGVHRLVRISPFDASGRRHTSFASVEVMPEITDDKNIEIREEDIKVEAHRASGAGGQHINKTDSAIRITHIPTGIVVGCQNERSQKQNKEQALKMLKSKLLEIKEREHLDKIEDIKGDQMQIAWGSQIRSYVFMPYTLVKDHRTNYEVGNVNAVMDGALDGFIDAYLRYIKNGENA